MGNIGDEKCYLYDSCKCQTAGCVVRPDNGCPVYRYFKDLIVKDYENRLKADMVAMLTEIQLEIEELPINKNQYSDKTRFFIENSYKRCNLIIQQKINNLKAESEDKE